MRLRRESIADKISDALKHARFREGAILADTVVPQTADLRLLILCSMAYFSADRFPESDEFLKRAKRIDDTYPALNEFEAFIRLKSAASRDEAAVAYLTLSDSVPGVRRYASILKRIRSAPDFHEFQKKAKLLDHVRPGKPAPRTLKRERHAFSFPFRKVQIVIPVFILAAAAGAGVWLASDSGFTFSAISHPRPESEPSYIDTITIESEKYPLIDKISSQKTARFFYDEAEVRTLFDGAKKMMKDGDYNKAVVSINTILLSNANLSVKERASFLKKFFPAPEKISPVTVDPAELFAHRDLYEGAVLSFAGKAANVENTGGKTTFSLLLNFREKPRFDGLIEVYSDSDLKISNGDSLKLTGVMVHPSVGGTRPYVQAVKVIVN